MEKYYLDFGTGAGNKWIEGSLEDAMKEADECICYTQTDAKIFDADNNEIARRTWYGVEYNEEEHNCENPILFGKFGFYDDWYQA